MSPIINLLDIFQTLKAAYSATHGQIVQNFKLIQDFIMVVITCENEQENEGTRAITRLYINFSDTQWILKPQSVVECGLTSNSPNILWLSSLHARI